MAIRVSRRKISAHYADELLRGNVSVASQLAAFLVDTGRTRELELIVRDIEEALVVRGVVVADVTSARELGDATVKEITAFLKKNRSAKTVYLRESVDPTVLGGVRINLPGHELDATLRRKLTALKANKV